MIPIDSRWPRRGLYAITDGPRADLLEAVAAALRGGAAAVQYRDKTLDTARRVDEAGALVRLCAGFDVPLIINDDIELAARCAAAGVHLGRADADIAAARARLGPRAIVGASCYNDLKLGEDLSAAGASYLAFGSFFPSVTKPDAVPADVDILTAAARFGLPRVAIGGISPENSRVLIAAGADLLAVISGVFGQADIEAAARRYANLFSSSQQTP